MIVKHSLGLIKPLHNTTETQIYDTLQQKSVHSSNKNFKALEPSYIFHEDVTIILILFQVSIIQIQILN